MSENASVIFSNVSKSFGKTQAVKDLSFELPKGKVIGFLGPNGAGKTTSIRMIMSIFHPDAGTLSVLGSKDPLSIKDRLGYLPEERGLYKKMKIIDLLTYFGQLKGVDKRRAKDRALHLLNEHGLADRANNPCETLSKGLGQMVQILGTILHEPELVILDEPFSGLDAVNIEVILKVILDLKDAGKTVIFSTHILDQAEKLCDSILIFNKGEKVLDGTIREVKEGEGKSIHLDYVGSSKSFKSLPGVERVIDFGQEAELTLTEGADTQAILKLLTDQIEIRRFDTRELSLREIFIKHVGSEQGESPLNAPAVEG